MAAVAGVKETRAVLVIDEGFAMPGPRALGGQALTPLERAQRSQAVRKDSARWLDRRLPRKRERYRLVVGEAATSSASGAESVRLRQAMEEARRLGWLRGRRTDEK